MNQQKTIYIVAACVCIIILCVASFTHLIHHPTKTNLVQTKPSKSLQLNAVITITKEGFLPSTIAVQAGTKIIWINNDTAPHQPAAVPYPTRSSFPALYSPKALGENEVYSFVFTTPSIVHYDDQLNPTLTGTIEVK